MTQIVATAVQDLTIGELVPALFIFAAAIVILFCATCVAAFYHGRRSYRDQHCSAVLQVDRNVVERL